MFILNEVSKTTWFRRLLRTTRVYNIFYNAKLLITFITGYYFVILFLYAFCIHLFKTIVHFTFKGVYSTYTTSDWHILLSVAHDVLMCRQPSPTMHHPWWCLGKKTWYCSMHAFIKRCGNRKYITAVVAISVKDRLSIYIPLYHIMQSSELIPLWLLADVFFLNLWFDSDALTCEERLFRL